MFSILTLTDDKSEPFLSRVMVKLSQQYGPVVGLLAGKKRFVCVSGFQAVREALNNPLTSGRPDSFEFNIKTSGLRRGNSRNGLTLHYKSEPAG